MANLVSIATLLQFPEGHAAITIPEYAGSSGHSYITIDGVNYGITSNSLPTVFIVPIGTVIPCYASAEEKTDNSVYIQVNGVKVATGNKEATYNYTVVGSAKIVCNSTRDDDDIRYGFVRITET